MPLDPSYVAIGGLAILGAAIWLNHWFEERRWSRERATEAARSHPAE